MYTNNLFSSKNLKIKPCSTFYFLQHFYDFCLPFTNFTLNLHELNLITLQKSEYTWTTKIFKV